MCCSLMGAGDTATDETDKAPVQIGLYLNEGNSVWTKNKQGTVTGK